MEIVNRGNVFKGGKGTNHQSCAFPGICVLPSGRWISTCRAAPAKSATAGQHVLLSWSDNQGSSWSEPVSPFTPPRVDGKPGLFRSVHLTALGGSRILAVISWVDHSDPTLPFFNEETEGLLDTRLFLSESHNNAATWTEPKIVNTSPFNTPTPFTGPILFLPDGSWACQFETNKHYYDTSTWRHSSVLIFSEDEGKTWPRHTIASNDPVNRIFYWDQRPGLLRDGTILDLFWTYDNQAAVYLNIHARESKDKGRTWSEIWDTGVPGQPAPPVSLKNGRIAMVYVDRTAAPVIKARVSSDHGRTWAVEGEGVVYQRESVSQTEQKGKMQDAWAEMGKFSIGLPNTVSLPDGDVLVVYYTGPETNLTDVEWVRLRF